MKKTLLFLALTLLFCTSAFAAKAPVNPIDKAFAKHYNKAVTMVETKYIIDQERTAWENELDNAAVALKGTYKFDEDKARVDNYVDAAKKTALAAGELQWLQWSNIDVPPSEYRSAGTGGPGAVLHTEAMAYRDAALYLISMYNVNTERPAYDYIFKDTITWPLKY